jgi:hypothetical protein
MEVMALHQLIYPSKKTLYSTEKLIFDRIEEIKFARLKAYILYLYCK